MEYKEPEPVSTARVCPTCGLAYTGAGSICICSTGKLNGQAISTVVKEEPVDAFIETTLGGYYKIIAFLGSGGMGSVYKAQDLLMDRVVAVKIMHSHLASDAQNVLRFQQEARAASAIAHKNVISAYDFGITSDTNQPYLVMDFVSGGSLSDAIRKEGCLPAQRAMRIFTQTCEALASAHEKAVLHRDLKPSNIMLADHPGEADVVKLVDFGIAKMLPGSDRETQYLTQTGEIFGSPTYMSPEQFEGGTLDRRTDIYALGCVMYEALTGKPPFEGENVLETMYKHINELPQPFKTARPDLTIPDQLEAVVRRALEKDPDQRYQSMIELRNALAMATPGSSESKSVALGIQNTLSEFRRMQKKYSDTIWYFLAASVVLALISIGYWNWTITAKTLQEIKWEADMKIGQQLFAREDFDAAARHFYDAGLTARAFGSNDERYLESLRRYAWVLEAKEDYGPARRVYQKLNKLNEEEVAVVKLAQMAFAAISVGLEDKIGPEGKVILLKKSAMTIENKLSPNDPGLIPLLERLAKCYVDRQQFGKAEREYAHIIEIVKQTEGPQSVAMARALTWQGDFYRTVGQMERSKECFERAIHMYRDVLGSKASMRQIAEVKGHMEGRLPVARAKTDDRNLNEIPDLRELRPDFK